ncbi:MAG: hypothetical protein HOH93_00510, partial [Phycisphaerae bacterium]|nr:hypothetical protein [Phycisphaerae bacterium]
MSDYLVAAFYKFTKIEDPAKLQASIEDCCLENDVRGIVLLASEGINSTIAGSPEGVRNVL